MTVANALNALGITEYVLRSEPTNESEFNQYFVKIIGSTNDNMAIESTNPSDFGVTWSQVETKLSELQNAEPMRLLREERNRKLQETDWWVLPDRTASQEQKDYRQALRDLPSTASPELDDNGQLSNVTWPTKPE
tara:strand:- start:214 stop:618 length:405 start_codon:yes stop_codon:yes gene_type:complete